MNILGITQGASIDLFLNLVRQLRNQQVALDRIGAWVSFARYFRQSPTVAGCKESILYEKEWEVVANARSRKPDIAKLQAWEATLPPGAFWSSIIADRRLIYGRRSKVTQDNRVHFSDSQLSAILETALERLERLFDDVKPDVVLGFTPVTFGEILAAELARVKGVPCLMLYSSRIRNFFAFHDSLIGTSSHFLRLAERNAFSDEVRALARQILEEGKQAGIIYEGVHLTLRQGPPLRPFMALRTLPGCVYGDLRTRLDPVLRHDHHDPGHLGPWFYQHVHQPLRARAVAWQLSKSGRLLAADEIESAAPFAFYPLHSEPEVALQLLGRPYHKNQVELLRNLGASLPAGYTLVVKEHPRSFGLRPVSFYKQLMEIPNLRFVPVEVPSIQIVRHASLVAVISGTIGLEAAMIGKPLLILGHPKYSGLPETMARKCYNLFELPDAVRHLLTKYRYDEESLLCSICALIAGSVDVNVYSVLLNKADRYSLGEQGLSRAEKLGQDYEKLAHYTLQRIEEQKAA